MKLSENKKEEPVVMRIYGRQIAYSKWCSLGIPLSERRVSCTGEFCYNRFKPLFSATIGVDFTVKTICVGNRVVALQLWDTAGQERFRSITKQYFRKADGVLLLFDVTSEQSFLNVRNWIESVRLGVDETTIMALVGNKVDLFGNESTRNTVFRAGKMLAEGVQHAFL
uniref:Ras family protein n=1 Tax=Angiostrongylus cantonensis TaxID=6313 RepID=A0A0K0DDX3_ANGCA